MKSHLLKCLVSTIILVVLFIQKAQSQALPDMFVTNLNRAWASKNYPAIGTAIEATLQQRQEDITVLYAAYNYYLMIQPNVSKLIETVNKVQKISEALNKPVLNALLEEMQADLPEMIQEGVGVIPQSVIDQLHVTFHDEFPLISRGVRIQASLQK